MDTSELYIKMCQKAIAIQEAWEPEYGDWFIAEYGTFTIGTACFHYDMSDPTKPPVKEKYPQPTFQDTEIENGTWDKEDLVWLPRQDQIQELYWGKEIRWAAPELKVMYDSLHLMYDKMMFHYLGQFSSMEQFWLAFYYWEQYSKIWSGEDWITYPQGVDDIGTEK